jgi:predicted metal-binding membrane protein
MSALARVGRVTPVRDLRLAAVAVVAIAAACWWITAGRMEGMDMGPGTELGSLGWFTGVWLVMMAAMMLPSLAPKASLPFAAGFLVPWLAAGVVAYALVEGVRSLDLAFLAWDQGGRYVAGAVIAGAALWELTPAKHACLGHCRASRRPEPSAAAELRSGVVEGTFCIGCCWALMAALFALGVMSITWMVVIAGVIAFEKLWPSERLAEGVAVAVLLVVAAGVVFFPDQLPGLTVPTAQPMTMPASM